jgi:3-hydroxyisobutyrate dehydrogenase-like beta-hydroxyacid dehydrogenase
LGQLFVVAAGAPAAIEAAHPIFGAIGQRTFVVSETPKAANLVKLSGTFLIATVIDPSAKRWRSSTREASTSIGISTF